MMPPIDYLVVQTIQDERLHEANQHRRPARRSRPEPAPTDVDLALAGIILRVSSFVLYVLHAVAERVGFEPTKAF
jgi:hypothetical protein